MSKDKKKNKDEGLDLAALSGMVRVRAILRKHGVSSHEADLVTEALDDMVSQAVSEIADRLEKRLSIQKWVIITFGGFITLLLTIITVFMGLQSLGS